MMTLLLWLLVAAAGSGPPAAHLTVEPGQELSFGTRASGGFIEGSFVLHNTGTAPLIIQDVQTSCDCTMPKFRRRPLAAGASQPLTIRFDTAGRHGQQRKTLIVVSNSDNGPVVLNFSGILQD